jgi:hypothetical protein
MAEGSDAGLDAVERLAASGELDGHHLLHATRADLLARLDRAARRPPPTPGRSRWVTTAQSGASSNAGWPT